MSTYETLDQEIVTAIRAGSRPLYASAVFADAQRIADAYGREAMRVIDGRLQALRKAGRIAANRKADSGWMFIIDAASNS